MRRDYDDEIEWSFEGNIRLKYVTGEKTRTTS